jgi:methylthioribose-1-phosphate isomerase
MRAYGQHYRTIWLSKDDPGVVQVIDQRRLPHQFIIENLASVDEVAVAIADMHVRGAGLIGAAAGYGMYLAALHAPQSSPEAFMAAMVRDGARLAATRPTAVNLQWAVNRQLAAVEGAGSAPSLRIRAALAEARAIADEDADFCRRIGQHGVAIIREISESKRGQPVNILTHCNAGWLAFVDYGSATAPIYAAYEEGIPLHVWVDETRPRNQGARLTAWEMVQQGVPHTVIADNVGGHLMQHGLVDLVIVGADRVAYTGDAANKIGTYLKALAARDNGVPFYVALPSSTFDWELRDGVRDIPIEQRDGTEVRFIEGLHGEHLVSVLLPPAESPAANYAFDVTPARLVTGLITERGICAASEAGILGMYPEKQK